MTPNSDIVVGVGGSALVALAAFYLGPHVGLLAVLITAGLAGSLVGLNTAHTETALQGVKRVALYTFVAAVLAGSIATVLGPYFKVAAVELIAIIAFIIAFVGPRWIDILNVAITAAKNLIKRLGGQ